VWQKWNWIGFIVRKPVDTITKQPLRLGFIEIGDDSRTCGREGSQRDGSVEDDMVRTGEEAQDLWCGSIYELKMGLKDFLLFIIVKYSIKK